MCVSQPAMRTKTGGRPTLQRLVCPLPAQRDAVCSLPGLSSGRQDKALGGKERGTPGWTTRDNKAEVMERTRFLSSRKCHPL